MNKKIYYKVVRRYPRGFFSVVENTNPVQYKVNKWSYPRAVNKNFNCLFIFKELDKAYDFHCDWGQTEIWECEAGHVFGPPGGSGFGWPKGTICTTKVKLIKPVYKI